MLFTLKSFGIFSLFTLIPVFKIGSAKHLMVILLSLEVFSLMVMLMFALFFHSSSKCAAFFLMIFSVFVCEACLGLGVLINSSRELGGDQVGAMF